MTITLDYVQGLADQLSLTDKARLASHLNTLLAAELAAGQPAPLAETTSSHTWERLLAFRRDIVALEGDAPDFAAQLDTDRRTRAEALEGPGHVHH